MDSREETHYSSLHMCPRVPIRPATHFSLVIADCYQTVELLNEQAKSAVTTAADGCMRRSIATVTGTRGSCLSSDQITPLLRPPRPGLQAIRTGRVRRTGEEDSGLTPKKHRNWPSCPGRTWQDLVGIRPWLTASSPSVLALIANGRLLLLIPANDGVTGFGHG